jgi:hypothetical protein
LFSEFYCIWLFRMPDTLKSDIDKSTNSNTKLKMFNDWFYSEKDIGRVVLISKARMKLTKKLREEFCFMSKASECPSCVIVRCVLVCA